MVFIDFLRGKEVSERARNTDAREKHGLVASQARQSHRPGLCSDGGLEPAASGTGGAPNGRAARRAPGLGLSPLAIPGHMLSLKNLVNSEAFNFNIYGNGSPHLISNAHFFVEI